MFCLLGLHRFHRAAPLRRGSEQRDPKRVRGRVQQGRRRRERRRIERKRKCRGGAGRHLSSSQVEKK